MVVLICLLYKERGKKKGKKIKTLAFKYYITLFFFFLLVNLNTFVRLEFVCLYVVFLSINPASVCLCVCLYICLSTCLFLMHVRVDLFPYIYLILISLSIYLLSYLFIYWPTSLSIYLSIIYKSMLYPVSPSIYLFIYFLSLCLLFYLFLPIFFLPLHASISYLYFHYVQISLSLSLSLSAYLYTHSPHSHSFPLCLSSSPPSLPPSLLSSLAPSLLYA